MITVGTWDVGPFDSDHAADFASAVIGSSDTTARHDLLAITFGAFMDMPDVHPELIQMEDGYELPYTILEVIASAAYVADTATGDTRWVSSVYARGSDLYDAGQFVELGEISDHLVVSAYVALTRAVRLMRAAKISDEWIQPSAEIRRTLKEAMHDGSR